MQLVHVRDRLPRIRQLCLVVLSRFNFRGRLAVDGFPQLIELPLVLTDERELPLDFALHALEGVGVGFIAEDDDVSATPAGLPARIELVRVCGRRESDVAGGQKEDSLALAALAEV